MTTVKELYAQLETEKEAAKAVLGSGSSADIKAAREKIQALKDKIQMAEELEAMEKENTLSGRKNHKAAGGSAAAFAEAARAGFPRNQMSEGSKEDGGYTVPEDIDTQIREFRESKDSLETLVTVEPVQTLSGARTYKTRKQQTGFTKVNEGAAIGAKETPQFSRITYTVEKYAGYFPVTNELLEDTDANLVGTLIRWIGDESRITRNKLILKVLKTIGSEVDLSSPDELKKALNVTLDPAFRPFARIVTNQDGFQYLDTMKDTDSRYLLQPDVTNPTQYRLFGFPVTVISNADMPSDTTSGVKAPVYVGDLKSAVTLFDRKRLAIASSDIAMDAFEKDLTIWRAIERLQAVKTDDKAVVRGFFTVSAGA